MTSFRKALPKTRHPNYPTSLLPRSRRLYPRSRLGGLERTPSSNCPRMLIPCQHPHIFDENLPSNTNASSGSAETNDVEERCKTRNSIERRNVLKASKSSGIRRSFMLAMRETCRKTHRRGFRSWRKFSSPSKLSSTPNPRLSTLSPVAPKNCDRKSVSRKATSKKAASISKTVEEERDRALTRARKASDAQTTAQSRIKALEGELTVKSQAIDTLTTDLLRPTSAYKDSQLHGRELEDAQTTTPPAELS